jgi:hypothetical protein
MLSIALLYVICLSIAVIFIVEMAEVAGGAAPRRAGGRGPAPGQDMAVLAEKAKLVRLTFAESRKFAGARRMGFGGVVKELVAKGLDEADANVVANNHCNDIVKTMEKAVSQTWMLLWRRLRYRYIGSPVMFIPVSCNRCGPLLLAVCT